MRHRTLGQTEIQVSVVGIGCNAFGTRVGQEAVDGIVESALASGVTFFDTADVYGPEASEEMLGRALGSRRAEAVVATKFGMSLPGTEEWGPAASRGYLRRAVEASLRRLGTDYIDLYQLHRPDSVTPTEETLRALDELVAEGKIRAYGCSQFTAPQLREAAAVASEHRLPGYATTQAPYSLYDRSAETEIIPALLEHGMSLLPYWPLAYGLLSGKYRRDQPAPAGSRLSVSTQSGQLTAADFDRIEALEAYAADRGVTLLDVAIGGLAAQPSVASVIAGVSRPDQVVANARAGSWEPSAEDLRALEGINREPLPAR